MPLSLRAPGKVNLLLNILGRRADGFHELETVFQPIALFDELTLEVTGSGIELSCSDPSLPVDSGNLVVRAAQALLAASGVQAGLRIHLEKHIPLAAGLGGGSADAATTLRGLNQLFGAPLGAERLQALAAQLGSDVPFFLQDRPALATGRGEHIQPLEPFPVLRGVWVLLLHPGFGIATAWAYRELARFPSALRGRPGRAAALVEALRQGDLPAAAAQFYNALEAPAFHKYPVLELWREFLETHGALASRMSGSGSTVFALVPGEAAGVELHERFQRRFGDQAWSAVVPLAGGGGG